MPPSGETSKTINVHDHIPEIREEKASDIATTPNMQRYTSEYVVIPGFERRESI